MVAPCAKKNRQACGAGGSLGLVGVSLAGPFRQQAREEKVKAEEPAAHGSGFKHDFPRLVYLGQRTIWVQRNCAIFAAVASTLTTASHTWVVRPRCSGVARHRIAPSRTVPRKLAFSSMVVKPLAPRGSPRPQPQPPPPSAAAAPPPPETDTIPPPSSPGRWRAPNALNCSVVIPGRMPDVFSFMAGRILPVSTRAGPLPGAQFAPAQGAC